jgi:Ni/Fe-hydrogenase subunit HybB-like protein
MNTIRGYSMKKGEPIGGKILTPPFILCLALALIAAYFLAKRFMLGLGAVINMNDGYPWGIWIAYDVVIGTALGCGGYAMALLVYVLNRGRYHSLVHPALLASVMGYTLAGFSVFIDIGRYWHMYNIFLPWYANTRSVLLEVAICIGVYCMVLWIEFSPVIFQKLNLTNLNKKLDKVMFCFIALGVLLPTMHQSSLGTLMIMAGKKLSPLWWTPFLPLLFLTSAITMGYAFVVFESKITTLRHKSPDESHLLVRMASIFPWLIGFYMVIRFGDLIYRGQLGLAVRGDLLGNLFLLENFLYIAPVVFLASPAIKSNRSMFFSAVSLLLAGSLYRLNTFIIGFNPGGEWTYFPAAPEILVTLGIVSVELMVYLWFIKRLPVFVRS